VLGRGRIAENEHLYAPTFVAHAGARNATRAEDRAATEGWRQAFPNLEVRVLQMVAENDLVAVHFTARGTNTGSGNGLPATGASVEAGGNNDLSPRRRPDSRGVELHQFCRSLSARARRASAIGAQTRA
jgi:hypothetical protein